MNGHVMDAHFFPLPFPVGLESLCGIFLPSSPQGQPQTRVTPPLTLQMRATDHTFSPQLPLHLTGR